MFKLNYKKLLSFLSVFALTLASMVNASFAAEDTFATKACNPIQLSLIHI